MTEQRAPIVVKPGAVSLDDLARVLAGQSVLLDPAFWWLMLMVAVWAVFALMVFVLEPLVVHRLFHNYALRDKERAFALAIWLHAVALTVAVVAIAAGVLGAHGA